MRSKTVTMPLVRARAGELAMVVLFGVLTGLASRVVVHLPGNPVPMTLQVMPVLLSGLVLGWPRGALAQGAYLAAVLSGLPLDAKMLGAAALVGPTGGYLLGFVVAAAVAGWLTNRWGSRAPFLAIAAIAGLASLYICGALWLAAATGMSAGNAWRFGVQPFIVVDAAKATLAVAIARAWRRGPLTIRVPW